MMCETLAFWNLTSCSQLCGFVRVIFKRQAGWVKCTKTGKRLNCEVVHNGQKGNWSHWLNLIWLACLCPKVTCYIKGQQPALCHAGIETKNVLLSTHHYEDMWCVKWQLHVWISFFVGLTFSSWGGNFAFPLLGDCFVHHCTFACNRECLAKKGGCIIKCNSSVRVGRPTNSVKLSPYTANAAGMSPGRGERNVELNNPARTDSGYTARPVT